MTIDHDQLIAMLDRLKLTAIRDQLDPLLHEAARSEMTCGRPWASSSPARLHAGMNGASAWRARSLSSRSCGSSTGLSGLPSHPRIIDRSASWPRADGSPMATH